MNLCKIVMTRFMSHDHTEVELPARGVVLVTGPNGAGKSSLVEAVSSALWGKTLRGTAPWREDGESSIVAISTDFADVQRTRADGKTRLWWARPDAVAAEPHEYESAAKAQEALEKLVGLHDVWRRTSVFSSSDAAHFTMATDGERKRLLETVLGLGRFDDALEACRADLKVATTGRDEAAHLLERAQLQLQSAEAAREEAIDVLGTLPAAADLGSDAAELARLDQLIKKYDKDIRSSEMRLREWYAAAKNAEADVRRASGELDAFPEGCCPTCGAPAKPEKLAAMRARLSAARAAAQKTVKKHEAQVQAETADKADLEGERDSLLEQRSLVSSRVASGRAQEATRRRLEGARDAAQELVLAVKRDLEHAQHALEDLARAVGELEACEVVLGLRGVRAHILGRALGGLEQVANAWLARVAGPDLRVRLKPYSEKKTGGVSDAISFEVLGAGGGHGYRGASGGERRRIDIACLLALAEVAQHAHGRPPGTLYFDEVFDALDHDGVVDVSKALSELARDRAVVVVTHNHELGEMLDARLRLRVASGRVDVVGSGA